MDDSAALVAASTERSDGYWLVIRTDGYPTMRLDVRLLDRIFSADGQLFLEVDSVVIKFSTNCSAAELAAALAPFTRSAPLREETYEDAKRRMSHASSNRTDDGSRSLYVDDLELTIRDRDVLLGGVVAGSLVELIEAAQQGMLITLQHPRGAYRMDAVLGAVVVAAGLRPVEDTIRLGERIAAYERERALTPNR